jgi:superfamily II DNA or RNA helicase
LGRAGEVAQVANVLTGNDIRARSVALSIERYVDDVGAMKALAFCTSVEHARYMAGVFTKMGLAAVAISGEDPQHVREEAVARLQTARCRSSAPLTCSMRASTSRR